MRGTDRWFVVTHAAYEHRIVILVVPDGRFSGQFGSLFVG